MFCVCRSLPFDVCLCRCFMTMRLLVLRIFRWIQSTRREWLTIGAPRYAVFTSSVVHSPAPQSFPHSTRDATCLVETRALKSDTCSSRMRNALGSKKHRGFVYLNMSGTRYHCPGGSVVAHMRPGAGSHGSSIPLRKTFPQCGMTLLILDPWCGIHS